MHIVNMTIKDIHYSSEPLCCKDCLPLPRPVGAWKQKNLTYKTIVLIAWSLNPQNSQELVYIRQHGSVHQVFYFNRHTQTHRLLQEGLFDTELRWHSNGWILFRAYDETQGAIWVYKMKPTGEKQALTRYECLGGMTWDATGHHIAFYPKTKRQILPLHVFDAQTGCLVGTKTNIPLFTGFFDWNQPNILVGQHGDGRIGAYNMTTGSETLLFEGQGGPLGFAWLDDSKTMVIANGLGLYVTHTETKQFKKIKCACGTLVYSYPAYGAQCDKIYALRRQTQIGEPPQNNTNIHIYTHLVQMNLDGSNEQIIRLPHA